MATCKSVIKSAEKVACSDLTDFVRVKGAVLKFYIVRLLDSAVPPYRANDEILGR